MAKKKEKFDAGNEKESMDRFVVNSPTAELEQHY